MSPRTAGALVLAGVLALGACGAGEGKPRAVRAQPAADTVAQADLARCAPGATTVEGGLLRVPSGTTAGRTPLLVVVIPGGGGDANDRLGLVRGAARLGIAVLYPTSEHGGFWTLNDRQGRDDVDDVSALLDRVVPADGSGCFDPARVSITGVSNGAGFAARMGCERPGRFAAVVPVAGGFRALDPCPPSAGESFEAIHGRSDTVVPYNGRKPGREGSVPRFAARWARRAGCSATPRTTTPKHLVTRIAWRGCDGGRHVGIVALTGSTHGWPGVAVPRFPAANPSGFRATPEVLRFVSAAPPRSRP